MKTYIDKKKNALLREYHALLVKAGIDDDGKMALLSSYGVESGKDLNAYELMELCGTLYSLANPTLAELDKWRKRLLGAIGGYLRAMGKESDMVAIKAVACRAARSASLNAIPLDRLKSLYNAFSHRSRDIKVVSTIADADIMDSFVGSMVGNGFSN